VDEPARYAPPSSERVVFATGESPTGERFEIVGYSSDQLDFPRHEVPGPEQTEPATCVQVVFPERSDRFDAGGGAGCYWGGPTERTVRLSGASFDTDGDGFPASASGEANARTRSVELTYETRSDERRTVTAAIAPLGGELGERIGVRRPTAFFFGFLPGLTPGSYQRGGGIEAVAYDSDGDVIGRHRSWMRIREPR
jgi:hypothetical protein